MNTFNTLSIDVITRAVTGSLPDLEKVGDDLMFQVVFTNGGISLDPGTNNNASPVVRLLFTLKDSDTGEILLQSNECSYLSGNYYLHASLVGSPLQQSLGKGKSVSLLGEIEWFHYNPFYTSNSTTFGPATIRTSSQNFVVTVGAALA